MYLCDSIASLEIFCISTGDFEASLLPLLSRLNKFAWTVEQGVCDTGRLCTILVVICKMALQTKSFQLILEDQVKEYVLNMQDTLQKLKIYIIL